MALGATLSAGNLFLCGSGVPAAIISRQPAFA
jgi:hypothetical protein